MKIGIMHIITIVAALSKLDAFGSNSIFPRMLPRATAINEMRYELHEGFENVYTHLDKIEDSLTQIEDKEK
ncbi:hypothetical protein [Bacillus pumilus]|uniref:hypothetical protein n=1 Tax=Bacillus pumilus TaxID=1408 RepID=UPI000D024391|nr:hypothetical protein [Bacillus pumilus]PRS29955.1 hypothetical protein C6X99_02100 [Bacillus pumilus]